MIFKSNEIKGKKLLNLIIAEGEATGHKHEVTSGDAELYQEGEILYLRVNSETAELTHQEHKTLTLPKGDYKIEIQREYVVGNEKYRQVRD
jgi:hypothetical protein